MIQETGSILITPEGIFSAEWEFQGGTPTSNYLLALEWAQQALADCIEEIKKTQCLPGQAEVIQFASYKESKSDGETQEPQIPAP